jgi:hypothetical protein
MPHDGYPYPESLMKVRAMLWLGLILVAAAWQAHAQVEPYEEYGKHLRAAEEVTPLTSNLFGDQVSLYNGGTEFDVTDIDLPGNSSLPVRLARRFTITDRRQAVGNLGGFGEWDIEVPYIDGVFAARMTMRRTAARRWARRRTGRGIPGT